MVIKYSNGLQHLDLMGLGGSIRLTGQSPDFCKSLLTGLTTVLMMGVLISFRGQLTTGVAAPAACTTNGGGALVPSGAVTLQVASVESQAVEDITQLSTRTPSATDEQCLQRFVSECVQIQPGSDKFPAEFTFGPASDRTSRAEANTIKMTDGFRISRYETTQELYQLIMQQNPSRWKGPRNSVESMTFAEAQQFCEAMTARLRSQNLISITEEVRLPTELEWEYCCRAGTVSLYSFGDKAVADSDREPRASLLDPFAWHTGNAAGNDPAVGVLKPNNWGLYDMHGYLWEFVSGRTEVPVESADNSTRPPQPNSQASQSEQTSSSAKASASKDPVRNPDIVIRGGSWKDHYSKLNSASRQTIPADTRDDAIGFRCVIAKKP